MSYTSRVSSGDEVSDATVNTRTCVPQDFGRATVVHGRRPDSKDDVLGVESTIIKQSLVLHHAFFKWDIIILAPATERMEEEDRVFVTLLEELLASVFKEENVAIVERITHLESVHGISILGLNCSLDLLRVHSVLV